MTRESDIDIARNVIRIEREALEQLEAGLDTAIEKAADLIMATDRHIIVAGVGKSGHIGQKIAASLASTGTPSFFLHPTEASHGDLGMIVPGSVVIAISYSGESRELRDPLIFCQRRGIPVIGMTQRPQSFLGRNSAVLLQLPQVAEACPNNLAPTTSTLMTLALGDALAMVLMERRGFSAEAFGLHHPGGKLGMSLQSVRDWMGDRPRKVATVTRDTPFAEVISAITEGMKGATAVVEADGRLAGIVTDGDVRRAFGREPTSLKDLTAGDLMSASPKQVSPDARMSDAVDILTQNRISTLLVVEADRPVAIIHLAELMQAGYVS